VALPEIFGAGQKGVYYSVSDQEMAAGSTLGGPKCVAVIKATGAIEKIYSTDCGKTVVGTVVAHHWDHRTGIALSALPGSFTIYPEHQEHRFTLSNGVEVTEDVFVLSGKPNGDVVDLPGVFYSVELHNATDQALEIETYGFAQLRGDTVGAVRTRFDRRANAIVATDEKDPRLARAFACSVPVTSWETTMDHGKAISKTCPGMLSGKATSPASDPMGALHLQHALQAGERASFTLLVTLSIAGARDAIANVKNLPSADDALSTTQSYYREVLNRSAVVTPDAIVNRGVLWAKANMLRVQSFAPQGWCFVNDPARSSNSVARDTAWYAFGADYVTPEFAEASLMWYVEHLEKSGMVIEYYDIRTGKTNDYNLNVNDNTPLLIVALWHHYSTTGNREFLERVFPAARKAADYLLSQRDERGLVWCTADGEATWGIVGWRNVIERYQLSGATTEVNSECFAALRTMSQMARVLGLHDQAQQYQDEAAALRAAINKHLFDPATGLYYLNIDLNGERRTDVTSDLIFPVMFGVADDKVASDIVGRLSVEEFWTDAGIRTVPRNALNYGPTHGFGLLGGVWVGVTFWYAFAAAKFNPGFMAEALSKSFVHYARDPRRNNTVPGQFSEWLHGETLVNQGMMLSPWFPPRYVWAAIEGAAGLDLSGDQPAINPRLSPDWKWIGVRNLPLAGKSLTWFVVRAPEIKMYSNFHFQQASPYTAYDREITEKITIGGDAAVGLALRQRQNMVLFVGNTTDRTLTTAIGVSDGLSGTYAMRVFNSMRGAWVEGAVVSARELESGIPVQVDRKGFCVFELHQEA